MKQPEQPPVPLTKRQIRALQQFENRQLYGAPRGAKKPPVGLLSTLKKGMK